MVRHVLDQLKADVVQSAYDLDTCRQEDSKLEMMLSVNAVDQSAVAYGTVDERCLLRAGPAVAVRSTHVHLCPTEVTLFCLYYAPPSMDSCFQPLILPQSGYSRAHQEHGLPYRKTPSCVC